MLMAINVTVAPRVDAASARAIPCLPEDLLPMNRTESIGSLVPPAAMVILLPAKSWLVTEIRA